MGVVHSIEDETCDKLKEIRQVTQGCQIVHTPSCLWHEIPWNPAANALVCLGCGGSR